MTHLQNIILSVLNGIKNEGGVADVTLQTRAMANVQTADMEMPCAVCYCISDWRLDIRSMRRREAADVNVLFLVRQTDYGFDGEENSALVAPMEDVATVFVARMLAIPNVDVEGTEINARTVFDEYDTNTTGVQLTMRVRELQGECLSTELPEPEPEPEPEP